MAARWMAVFAFAALACGGQTKDDVAPRSGGGTFGGGGAPDASATGGVTSGGNANAGGGTGAIDGGGSSATGGGGGTGGSTDAGGSDAAAGAAGAGATGGNDGGVTVSCSTKSHPTLAGCASTKTSWPKNATVSGPVVSTGPPAYNACGPTALAPEAFAFDVTDVSGELWSFVISVPGFSNPLSVGQVVNVDAGFELHTFAPTRMHVTLRDASGNLLGYVGQDGDPAWLPLPAEVDVQKGPAICTQYDYCGTWDGYDLLVAISGDQEPLGYGETKTIGGYDVTHGGYEVEESGSGTGYDWFVAHVAIGVKPSQ